jgi:glycine oxidase
MARSPDVIVVGAGIIGCAVTWELARRGASVQIFESRTIGAGATQASAGVLAPYIEGGASGPLLEMTVRSLDLYDDFVREVAEDSGIAIEYRRCGTLEVAMDDETAARFRQRAEASPGRLQWLDVETTRREVPVGAPARGALLAPAHGYVDAPVLTEALAWSAMRHDARIETGQRVLAIEQDGSGPVAIRTADGAVSRASTVVIAAGSWSTDGAFTHLRPREDVRPIRGQLLRLRTDAALPRILWGPDCYIVPRDNGLALVGATVEDVGFDERTTAAGVRDLLDAACGLVPELWRAAFVEARAGLRPATASGLPVIARSPANPNVIYATGHFRNGVLLAPLTAKLVADLVAEQPKGWNPVKAARKGV